MKAQGRAHIFGDNIDTDGILPARYLNLSDKKELAAHCLEDVDRDFVKKAAPGDLIVAGENFGCGSSREHAPLAIIGAEISCVIAKSFARIFYRNAVNTGLPILECPAACERIAPGDEIEINFEAGTIANLTKNEVYEAAPFPPFIKKIMDRGGLLNSLKT